MCYLKTSNNQIWSTGISDYREDEEIENKTCFVSIKVSLGNDSPIELAFLDTGSEFNVCSFETFESLNLPIDKSNEIVYSTRFGSLSGYLNRQQFVIHADFGDSLMIEGTFFITEFWKFPIVIGWKGCLEKVRFALDPGIKKFYFGVY